MHFSKPVPVSYLFFKNTSITHSANACIFYPNTFVKQERNPDTSVGITRRLISF